MTPVQRSESSRRAILAAALELVAEVGYAKLSIEGIASRAGVGKQTIYRWWPSKGAVLFDAVLALSEDEAGDIALPDTGDLEADLKYVLRATVDEFNDPRQDRLLRALSIEIIRDPTLAELYAERLDAPLHERKKARLKSALAELDPAVDLDVAVELIWSPLAQRWLNHGPLSHEFTDTIVELALRGLRAREHE